MNRKCEVDVRLSNGLVLPKGTHIGVAAGANAFDPEYNENASEFDGFRFEKLRSKPGNDNKYQVCSPQSYYFLPSAENPPTKVLLTAYRQLVTTNNADQLHWGVGLHACPGRFFATYEIKLLLARILLTYDMELPAGTERPQDFLKDIRVMPNPVAGVLFRNIKA